MVEFIEFAGTLGLEPAPLQKFPALHNPAVKDELR